MFMIYVIYLLPTYMAYVYDKNVTTTRNEIVVNNKQKVSCKLLRLLTWAYETETNLWIVVLALCFDVLLYEYLRVAY